MVVQPPRFAVDPRPARRRTALRLLELGLVLGLAACRPSSPPAAARVGPIERPEQLLWGASAMGAIGDYRIENEHLVAVIAHPERAVGFAVSGGNLVDLAPLPDGEDHLNQITLYLNDQFPRQADYDAVEIVAAGGPGKRAVLRAIGVDTKNPRIRIETDYVLEPDARWLTLETRFTSSSTGTVRAYEPGEAIQWGRSEHLAPGFGRELPGKRLRLPWVAGLGRGASYAWVPETADSLVMSGSVWSDPIGEPVDLEPKRTLVYRRHIVVGTGDTASLSAPIATLRKTPVGRLVGTVKHDGAPVTDARVVVDFEDGRLAGLADVDAQGFYEIHLPPGRYGVQATSPGREPVRTETPVEVQAGRDESRSFSLGQRASIAWRIAGPSREAPPVKVTILGRDGTRDPEFGPTFRGSGARQVILSPRGLGEAPVGVGKFRVLVSRGPEHELIDREVEVGPGARVEITGELVRSVPTPGLIAAELHQHAAPSYDSGVSLEDRARSAAAEAVEVLVSTDHNVVIDYRPVLAALGLGRSLTSVIGTEATTHSVGHFNAFPLRIDRADPRGGMKDVEGYTPDDIFALVRGLAAEGIRPIIQVNHPRAHDIGFSHLMGLDPKTGRASDPRFSTDFDAFEVVLFGFDDETEAGLADWFALLRRGHRITATGNSDSHTIFGRETGWPRNYVCVDDDLPYRLDVPAFVTAIRSGCVTVSTGPLVTLRSGEVKMGGLAAAPGGELEVEVEVRAASWIPTRRLRLYVDGEVRHEQALDGREIVRHQGRHRIRCRADCFVVARVDAPDSLAPVVTTWRGRKPHPDSITNPIYVDVDGDGAYRREESARDSTDHR